MSYTDENGNVVLYRALYSVTKDGKKLIITSHVLDDNDNVIVNPRTKAYIQEQGKKEVKND